MREGVREVWGKNVAPKNDERVMREGGDKKGRSVRFRCVASEVWNMSGMEAEASLDPRRVWQSVVSEACASGGVSFGRNVHANFPSNSPVPDDDDIIPVECRFCRITTNN